MAERGSGKSGGIYFKVTDEERGLIEQKMALAGVHNMNAYIRKMCIDGYIINLQIKELDECAKLLRYTSNHVSQIAHRVNSGGDLVTAYQCNPSIADQEFLFPSGSIPS